MCLTRIKSRPQDCVLSGGSEGESVSLSFSSRLYIEVDKLVFKIM